MSLLDHGSHLMGSAGSTALPIFAGLFMALQGFLAAGIFGIIASATGLTGAGLALMGKLKPLLAPVIHNADLMLDHIQKMGVPEEVEQFKTFGERRLRDAMRPQRFLKFAALAAVGSGSLWVTMAALAIIAASVPSLVVTATAAATAVRFLIDTIHQLEEDLRVYKHHNDPAYIQTVEELQAVLLSAGVEFDPTQTARSRNLDRRESMRDTMNDIMDQRAQEALQPQPQRPRLAEPAPSFTESMQNFFGEVCASAQEAQESLPLLTQEQIKQAMLVMGSMAPSLQR